MKHDRPVLGVGAREGPEGSQARTGGGARGGAERLRGRTDWGGGPAISTPGPRNVPTLTKTKEIARVTFFPF